MLSKPYEQIEWIDVNDDLPDEELLVLVFTPDDSEPVTFAFMDGGTWYGVTGDVVAWAEMPSGPGRNEVNDDI